MKTISLLAFSVAAYLGSLASQGLAQNYAVPQGIDAPRAVGAWSPALPADAREFVTQYDLEKGKIQKNTRKEIRELRLQLVKSLQELQNRYTREAKLDEAVAIRDCIRKQRESGIRAMPDPGMLHSYNYPIGKTLFFRITGINQHVVWGTDIYTADSWLASAAVHAGVLKLGQTGVVKVTILPGRNSYQGSTRNGIASSSWQNFPTSFKVEQTSDEDADEGEESPVIMPPQPFAMPSPETTYYGGSYLNQPRLRMDGYGMPATAYPAVNPVLEKLLELPKDAQELVDRFHADSASIQKTANRKTAVLRHRTIDQLKPLQDNYTREAKLDEAVAIRDSIRILNEPAENVLPDPRSLMNYSGGIGRVLHFRVTGVPSGTVWGSDVYTADSTLAVAAVHAGVLKVGQTGVVKVTILPGQSSYQGMTRNGISSYVFGSFPCSYKVEAVEDEEPVNPFEVQDKPVESKKDSEGEDSLTRQVEKLHREVARLQRQLEEISAKLNERHKE
jgi:hypothetical protein